MFRYIKMFLVSENNADYDAEMDLRSAISSFRSAFVSISLNNLLSPINSAFTVILTKYFESLITILVADKKIL